MAKNVYPLSIYWRKVQFCSRTLPSIKILDVPQFIWRVLLNNTYSLQFSAQYILKFVLYVQKNLQKCIKSGYIQLAFKKSVPPIYLVTQATINFIPNFFEAVTQDNFADTIVRMDKDFRFRPAKQFWRKICKKLLVGPSKPNQNFWNHIFKIFRP